MPRLASVHLTQKSACISASMWRACSCKFWHMQMEFIAHFKNKLSRPQLCYTCLDLLWQLPCRGAHLACTISARVPPEIQGMTSQRCCPCTKEQKSGRMLRCLYFRITEASCDSWSCRAFKYMWGLPSPKGKTA